MKLKISVIIPTFRRPKETLVAIRSVETQTIKPWEIIVVDDNGELSDNQVETRQILEQYISDKVITYVVHKSNLGGALARNTGAEQATGDLLAFLDSDDTWYARKLEAFTEAHQSTSNKEVGFFYSLDLVSDGYSEFVSGKAPLGNPLVQQMKNTLATTSSIAIPSDVFRSVGGFADLPSSQEADIILRILASGRKPVFINEVLSRRDISGLERISTQKALEDNSWIDVRMPYMSLIDKKNQRAVIRNFNMMKMSQQIAAGQRKSALSSFLRALSAEPLNLKSYIRSFQLFLPRDFTQRTYPRWRHSLKSFFN